MLARFDGLIDRLATPTPPAGTEAVQEQADLPEAAPPTTVARDTAEVPIVLSVTGLIKNFGATVAVNGIDLSVPAGSIFGIVGPNGAGKTTTLSMVTGLLRPDAGEIRLNGADVWSDPAAAKQHMGILPDRLMLFDRLTGRQMLYYCGVLRGLDPATVKSRTADLVSAFGIAEAQDRLVTDYSSGMTRKIALAAAMIHSPKVLVLDEPFESVDSVSTDRVIAILRKFADAGGTVILSSHSMDLVERICDYVAVVVDGSVLSSGTTHEVRGDQSLEERFIDLVSASNSGEDMEWLRSFSD
jgi:ABC-2 type transport system ATP-binding protein